MKYIIIALLFIYPFIASGSTWIKNQSDTLHPKNLDGNYIEVKYGNNDSSKALIRYFFKKEKTVKKRLVIWGIIAIVVVLAVLLIITTTTLGILESFLLAELVLVAYIAA